MIQDSDNTRQNSSKFTAMTYNMNYCCIKLSEFIVMHSKVSYTSIRPKGVDLGVASKIHTDLLVRRLQNQLLVDLVMVVNDHIRRLRDLAHH